MEISVSILNSNDRVMDVKKLNNTNCDYIHIDVMDGEFVNPTEFSYEEVIDIIKVCNKKIDVHLMCKEPIKYIEKLVNYNVSNITFHEEVGEDLFDIIDLIKKYNIGVGMSIKPNTSVDKLDKYLDKIDLVLVMSVEPGYGGQEFMLSSLDKVRELKKRIKDRNLDVKIEIDGGVKDTNINLIKESGVDISVVGSFVTKSDDFNKSINILKY